MNVAMTTRQSTLLAGLLLAMGLHGSLQAECAQGNENLWITPTAPAIQFDDRGDGTVVHNPSRLVWQRCALGQSWNGQSCDGIPLSLNWSQALEAADVHVQDGWSDWRLPNRNELASIVESRCFLPALDSSVFPDAFGGGYWTSSPVSDALAESWIVDFDDGLIEPVAAAELLTVRLVRRGWDD